MGEPFIGEIRMFGGSFAPAGWAFCSGALIPISENDTLFTLIGTTYGGDGQETFALPDLQSRVPMHVGNSHTLGEQGGVESVTLTTQQIPIHNHAMLAASEVGQAPQPQNAFPAQTNPGFMYVAFSNPLSNLNQNALQIVGGSQPHENLQPYLCISFIISLFGVFPSQT